MNTQANTAASVETIKADPIATTLLQLIRDAAAAEAVPVVAALRGTLAAHPTVTRVGFKHAAIAAGINWRTARNTFDRVRNELAA